MRRLIGGGLCGILALSMLPMSVNTYAQEISAGIAVDAQLDDWKDIPAQVSNDTEISEWKVAKNADGTVYFCFTGDAVSEWYGGYIYKTVNITQNGSSSGGMNFDEGEWGLAGVTGATVRTANNANGNSAADYVVEAMIPASYFRDGNYIISFAGNDIQASSVPVITGEEQIKEDAVYAGITIDGKFGDWDAVSRYVAGCPNDQHPDCIVLMTTVFDGDYVYVYIKEGDGGDATGAGTHSNGQYAITTDLNRELLFQLRNDNGGTVTGVDGAKASHVGSQWEVAIPANKLPQYRRSISVGLYQLEPFVTDVVNLQDENGNVGDPDTIVYDGLYGDWSAYPHTRIEYATAGTQEKVVDAEGALYSDGTTLFGHVITDMVAHQLIEAGKEYTEAITIRFNDDEKMDFYPRMVDVDAEGNIDWNPKLSNLDQGTYEFYIVSTDAWHTSENLSDVNSFDTVYGKIMITIGNDYDECEFYLDLPLIAEKFGCDASDFKTIAAQFGRIGQQWITTAGASSGPWIGLLICGVVVIGAVALRKLKTRKTRSRN